MYDYANHMFEKQLLREQSENFDPLPLFESDRLSWMRNPKPMS